MGGDGKGPGTPSDQEPNCDIETTLGFALVSLKPVRHTCLNKDDDGLTGNIFRYVVTYLIAWNKKAASTIDPKNTEKGKEIVIIA